MRLRRKSRGHFIRVLLGSNKISGLDLNEVRPTENFGVGEK